MSILQLDNVTYAFKGTTSRILDQVNASFEKGKFYSILGASGAGKSTLLSLLAGLDSPTEGRILFDGRDIAEKGYSHHRREQISLVFQNYNLIEYLTPLENLRLVNGKAKPQTLEALGLSADQANRNVLQLSGGQQQRVAIGRALVSKAPIILADEPTGNLDEETAEDVTQILRKAAHDQGKCVIVVTHSKQLANVTDVKLRLKKRKLYKED